MKSFLKKDKEGGRQARIAHSCLSALFLLLFWILTGSVSQAQYSASIISPADGSKGISTSPTIVVLASTTIDSTSVTWFADKDDTIFTISVMQKDVFTAAGSHAWPIQFKGAFSMPALNQLRFTPSMALDWNTEYIVILSGLRVLGSPGPGGPTLIPVPSDTITFRTQEAPHHLMSSSHFYGDPLCQCDTVKLLFNRKLDSTETASGPLVVMEKVYEDSLNRWGDSVVPFDVDFGLSSDSLELYVTFADSLELGESYRMRMLVNRLSGNVNDNREYPLFAPARWPIHVTPKQVGTDSILTGFDNSVPANSEVAYAADDSVLISAGIKSGYKFTRWIAPGLSSVDSSTSVSLLFVQPCRTVDIIAEYTPLAIDSVALLAADSGGYAIVYSDELDSLGGVAVYGYQEDKHIFLKAMPGVGYKFRQWNSNISAIHGRTDRFIKIPGLGGGWLEPEFEEEEEEPEYKYCGSIEGELDAVSHATLTTACHTTEEPESRTITCNILSPNGDGKCYRIVGRIDPDGEVHDFYNDPKTTDALTWTTDDSPVPNVVWYIEATPSYTLTVTIEDEDGNPVDGRASVLITPNKSSYLCGDVVTLTAQDDPVNGIAFEEWQPGGSTNKTLIVTMDENKSITAIFDESFAVTKYHWFKGTTAQTSTFSPHETVTDVQMLTLSPENSTYVTIEFNRPVNTSTVTSGSLWVEETGERIDGGALHRYHTGNCSEVSWYDNNTKLKLRLYDAGANVSVLKMQSLRVHVTDAIKSATGTNLDNPHTHNAIMEKPDVRWEMEVTVSYDTDPGGSGEIYGNFNAVRYGSKGLVTPQWNGKMPGGTPQNVSSPPNVLTTIASGHGFLAPSIADDEVLEMGVVVLDEDAGDVLGAIVNIAATVGGIIGAMQTAGILNPKTTVAIAGKLLSEVGKLQGTWFQDDDDNVTNANFRFGQADHWGAKASIGTRTIWRDYGAVVLIVTLE